MELLLRLIRVAQTEDPGRQPVLLPGGEQGPVGARCNVPLSSDGWSSGASDT